MSRWWLPQGRCRCWFGEVDWGGLVGVGERRLQQASRPELSGGHDVEFCGAQGEPRAQQRRRMPAVDHDGAAVAQDLDQHRVTKPSGPIARVTLRSNAAVTWARPGRFWAASRKLPNTTSASRTASRPLPRTSRPRAALPVGSPAPRRSPPIDASALAEAFSTARRRLLSTGGTPPNRARWATSTTRVTARSCPSRSIRTRATSPDSTVATPIATTGIPGSRPAGPPRPPCRSRPRRPERPSRPRPCV
jgi:hypothetical protein